MACLNEVGSLMGITKPDPKVYQSEVKQFDPLFGGGRDQRKQIFNYLDQSRPANAQDTENSVNALQSAAAHPGYGAAANLATDTINGKYLKGSPALDSAVTQMRSAAGRESSDAAANVRDQFSRNGLAFGTGNAQAQQSTKALGTAQANAAEAGMRMQNYQAERANQNNAVNTLNTAVGSPINYLSQVSSARLAPQAQQANIVQGLSGQGQVLPIPQDIMERDNYMGTLMGSVGKL